MTSLRGTGGSRCTCVRAVPTDELSTVWEPTCPVHGVPPTPRPQAGQGPWCTEELDKWWVVADSPVDALRVVADVGTTDLFPGYFGWKVTIEPVLIAWAEEFNGDEVCIDEQPYETEATVEAWRVEVEGR